METLKYTIIKSEKQYFEYCNTLETLVLTENNNDDEIELLTLLIEKWDAEHNAFSNLKPVELLKALMEENNLKAIDLAKMLGLTRGTVSKILNYQKGLSKDTIRKLAEHFKVSQEAFNRPYKIVNGINRHFRNESLMNTKKDLRATIA
jgi:HTH-type transcriptional regulator/antitoxin HigA